MRSFVSNPCADLPVIAILTLCTREYKAITKSFFIQGLQPGMYCTRFRLVNFLSFHVSGQGAADEDTPITPCGERDLYQVVGTVRRAPCQQERASHDYDRPS